MVETWQIYFNIAKEVQKSISTYAKCNE